MSYYLLIEPPNEGITEEELYHHGVKGMHWGIRRFQPYQPGAKVKGGKEIGLATKVKQRITGIPEGIKQHKAQKKKTEALKKAQATRKANLETAAAKKKAIESGTVEDLAKFKGSLTNEEYRKAFDRLQNEKKLDDMVLSNQKTIWDKIDKGMAVANKLAGYADTVTKFKNSTDAMSEALGKKKKQQQDKKEEREKNGALTKVTDLTELNEVQKKYNLSADDYNKGLKILQTKMAGKKAYGFDFVDKNTPVEGTYEAVKDKPSTPPKNNNPKTEPKPKETAQEPEKPKQKLLEMKDTVPSKPDSPSKDSGPQKENKPNNEPTLKFYGQSTIDPSGKRSNETAESLKAPTREFKNYKGSKDTTVLNAPVPTTKLNTGKTTVEKYTKEPSWESMSKEERSAAVQRGMEYMGLKNTRPTASNPDPNYSWDSVKKTNKQLLEESIKRLQK